MGSHVGVRERALEGEVSRLPSALIASASKPRLTCRAAASAGRQSAVG
jgi:hypothetical protein